MNRGRPRLFAEPMNSTQRNRRRIALLKAKEVGLKSLIADLAKLREDLIAEGDFETADQISAIVGRVI